MANKTLNTRITWKIDTTANWNAADPILLKGEAGVELKDGAVLVKIGDGDTVWSALPYIQAIAGDVYEWAKASTKPTYAATEITGLEAYISGKVQDTDTQYTVVPGTGTYVYDLMSKTLDETEFTTKVATIDLSGAASRLTALETKVGTDNVADQITAAIGTLDSTGATAAAGEVISAVTQTDGVVSVTKKTLTAADIPELAQSKITGLETALAGKQDSLTFDGVYNAATNKVATESTVSGAIEALDKADTAVAGQFVTQVSQEDGVISVTRAALAASDIPALAISKITGLQDALDGKQETLAFQSAYDATTNKAATMADVTAAVGGLAGAMHFKGTVTEVPPATGTYASGDVVILGNKEYVYDGTTWHELGDESIYAVKGSIVNADIADNAAIAQSKIAGLGTMASETAADYLKKTDAPGYDDILTATEAATTYVAKNGTDRLMTAAEGTKLAGIATGAQVNVIEKVSVNGVALTVDDTKGVNVTVPTGALASKDTVAETDLATDLATKINGKADTDDLADIAFSGSTDDLVQGVNTLVFNCGTATTVL